MNLDYYAVNSIAFKGELKNKGLRWGFTPDPTRVLNTLDPHERMLLGGTRKRCSRCCVLNWIRSMLVTTLSLSGTAALGRQAGCFASGENKRKCQGKGRLSAALAKTQQLGSGFSPGIFACFHCARKLAMFLPNAARGTSWVIPTKHLREEWVQGRTADSRQWRKSNRR